MVLVASRVRTGPDWPWDKMALPCSRSSRTSYTLNKCASASTWLFAQEAVR